MAGYVVRSPIKRGAEDGSVVWYQPGDELPADVSEEERLELLAAGSVVPAETHKTLEEHDEKTKQLREKRAELDAEQGRLLSEEGEMQAKAERELENARNPQSEEKKPLPMESREDVTARQQQAKADTRGVQAPTPAQSKAEQSKAEQSKSEQKSEQPKSEQKK